MFMGIFLASFAPARSLARFLVLSFGDPQELLSPGEEDTALRFDLTLPVRLPLALPLCDRDLMLSFGSDLPAVGSTSRLPRRIGDATATCGSGLTLPVVSAMLDGREASFSFFGLGVAARSEVASLAQRGVPSRLSVPDGGSPVGTDRSLVCGRGGTGVAGRARVLRLSTRTG